MRLAKANDAINVLFFLMNLEELFTLENLNEAFYESAKISYWKDSTQRYRANLLLNNIKLQEELLNGRYKVSPTINFKISERGKIRHIEAPSVRDRIVQKVICKKILVPQLTKYFIYDNYASLKNRGTSFARKRLDVLLHKYMNKYGNDGYILKVDIKKFFDSIDHTVLKEMLKDKLDAPAPVMNLIYYFIDTSSKTDKGLNLGAEIPQILAIFYLHNFDNYIKSVRGFKYYGRYMDDMFLISDDKEKLKEMLEEIKQQLACLKLEINEKKTIVTTLHHGFTFMQIKYNIAGSKIIKRPTRNKIVRERRRLKKFQKKYEQGSMSEFDIRNYYKSWRNSLMKDCNACYKTVQSMDKLYNELFTTREIRQKPTRAQIINDIFKEYSYEFGQNDYFGVN